MNRTEQPPPPRESSTEKPPQPTESSPPPPAKETKPALPLDSSPPEPAQEGVQQNEGKGSAPEPAESAPPAASAKTDSLSSTGDFPPEPAQHHGKQLAALEPLRVSTAAPASEKPPQGTSRSWGSQDSAEAGFIHDAPDSRLSGRQETVGWTGPSQAEIELRQREPTRLYELDPDNHTNQAYIVEFRGELRGVFKPKAGELPIHDSVPAGTYWQREIATYRVDEMLGFNLVPPTTNWSYDTLGDGSLQQWQEGVLEEWEKGTLGALREDIDIYSREDIDRMAVLDYVIANTDRHIENYLTSQHGRPVAIDHGCAFPESATVPIRSDWVVSRLNRPLNESVIVQVNQVNTNALRDALTEAGLGNEAINGAIARLNEIKNSGMITGRMWSGIIADADWNPATGA